MACRSLCRLCLQRMCRSINHQPRELPLPEVNSRSLTKGPGLIYADAGAATPSKVSDTATAAAFGVSGTSQSQCKPAGAVHTPNTANCSRTAASIVPHSPPVGSDSAMADVADDERGTMHAKTKSGGITRVKTDCSMEEDGEDQVMEGPEPFDSALSVFANSSAKSRRKAWPSSLPDLISSTNDQTCGSMKWLQEWLAYGESMVWCRFYLLFRFLRTCITQTSPLCQCEFLALPTFPLLYTLSRGQNMSSEPLFGCVLSRHHRRCCCTKMLTHGAWNASHVCIVYTVYVRRSTSWIAASDSANLKLHAGFG